VRHCRTWPHNFPRTKVFSVRRKPSDRLLKIKFKKIFFNFKSPRGETAQTALGLWRARRPKATWEQIKGIFFHFQVTIFGFSAADETAVGISSS